MDVPLPAALAEVDVKVWLVVEAVFVVVAPSVEEVAVVVGLSARAATRIQYIADNNAQCIIQLPLRITGTVL